MPRGSLDNGKTNIIRNGLTNKPPGTAPEIDARFEIEQILRSGRIHLVPPSKGYCDGGRIGKKVSDFTPSHRKLTYKMASALCMILQALLDKRKKEE